MTREDKVLKELGRLFKAKKLSISTVEDYTISVDPYKSDGSGTMVVGGPLVIEENKITNVMDKNEWIEFCNKKYKEWQL